MSLSIRTRRELDPALNVLFENPALAPLLISLSLSTRIDGTTLIKPQKFIGRETTIAGAVSIDLTAAPDARDPALLADCSTYKLLLLAMLALPNNAAPIVVGPTGGTPYPLFGTGNSQEVQPGVDLSRAFRLKDDGTAPTWTLPAVSAGAKTIQFSGTNGDKIRWLAVFGG